MSESPHGDGFYISPATLLKLGDGDAGAGRRILRAMVDLEVAHEPVNGPTERPPNVRAAIAADEAAILAMLREDFAENARHVAPMVEQRIQSFVEAATRENHATIGVIEADGDIVGMIYLTYEQWWWSDEWYLADRVVFVRPAHRSPHHLAALVHFGRWFADKMSQEYGHRVYFIASVVATAGAHAKVAAFRRLMSFAGGVFCYPDPRP